MENALYLYLFMCRMKKWEELRVRNFIFLEESPLLFDFFFISCSHFNIAWSSLQQSFNIPLKMTKMEICY
jgi:hypothetical protein